MLWLAPIAAVVCTVTSVDVQVGSLAALKEAARTAKPGDRLVLAPGVYAGTLTLDALKGEKGRPIVVAGADGPSPSIIRGGAEGVHLSRPAYVTIENLVIEQATGNGLNVDDGGDRSTLTPGVTLRNVRVFDIGTGCGKGKAGAGNCDGIKLSGLTGFTVESCKVERWGTGGSAIDMVGCHDGVIDRCTFRHDAPGSGEQPGGSGVQMKGGCANVTVRVCTFEHAGQRAVNLGGSTGLQYFRPPLPAGTTPRNEAAGLTVEGCTFVGSDAAVAFVGVDGATFRFNTIYHPRRWALRILQETRSPGFVPCRKGVFTDNIVVLDGAGPTRGLAVNVGDMTDAASFTFARNVWFGGEGMARPKSLPAPENGGTYGADPRLRDPEHGDLSPAAKGPGANAGASALPSKP